MKITLVAGLALLTTDALFAQSTDQSGVDSLKTQMNQMQRQYEQRIEAMEVKMKALESNAGSGSILNTHVLTDADGKAVAPAPMLDESFLKSLTRNFTFSVYIRSGVGFNGNGGPQDFDFEIPDFGLGRFRLGNEPDTYMELTWKQAHLLGDSQGSHTKPLRQRTYHNSTAVPKSRCGKRFSRQRISSRAHLKSLSGLVNRFTIVMTSTCMTCTSMTTAVTAWASITSTWASESSYFLTWGI